MILAQTFINNAYYYFDAVTLTVKKDKNIAYHFMVKQSSAGRPSVQAVVGLCHDPQQISPRFLGGSFSLSLFLCHQNSTRSKASHKTRKKQASNNANEEASSLIQTAESQNNQALSHYTVTDSRQIKEKMFLS